MSVEIIRKAICYRCGKDCYEIMKGKTTDERTIDRYVYSFFELQSKFYSSIRPDSGGSFKVCLCGTCYYEFGEWLKNESQEVGAE